jgi:hypothetical protein
MRFTTEEQELAEQTDTSAEAVIEEALQIARVRLVRMMRRIRRLEEGEESQEGMTRIRVVRKSSMLPPTYSKDGSIKDEGGPTEDTDEVYEGTLGQIQAIEAAITSLQSLQARLVEARTRARAQAVEKDALDADGNALSFTIVSFREMSDAQSGAAGRTAQYEVGGNQGAGH